MGVKIYNSLLKNIEKVKVKFKFKNKMKHFLEIILYILLKYCTIINPRTASMVKVIKISVLHPAI